MTRSGYVGILLALLCGAPMLHAATPAADDAARSLPLWAGDTPTHAGTITERSDDPALPDRIIENVRTPYLAVHAPARPSDVALLVTPGGGYARIVLDKEGTALVPAFVEAAGITLFVLRYRLPDSAHAEGADAPLADAQRAMRVIRSRAAEFGIDPARVGVMGFSAGGHVAARLATAGAPVHPARDATDRFDWRPAFAVLVYPVISMDDALAHAGSRARLIAADTADARTAMARLSPERHVDAATPPLFLLHAQDDAVVPVGNALAMHSAAVAAGVPASLHVFPYGGHGFGVRGAHGPLARWPQLVLDWINDQNATP